VKQIERNGSPQRQICSLLDSCPGLTVAEVAGRRKICDRTIARQLESLMDQGFLRAFGHPRRWYRTDRPIPEIAARKPKCELIEQRRQIEKERVSRPFCIPEPSDLERIFLTWQRREVCHAD
jgi:DeoR/GlpR family transcriptional regulator of sugar metabolism